MNPASRKRLGVWARALVLAACCSALSSPAKAWGSVGHRIVADLAERLLTSEARAELARLHPDGQRLSDLADWADDYRKRCRNTGPWHYVNIPLAASGYEPERDCRGRGGCVIRALADARAVLGDRARSTADRGLALRLLVHFVGDMHQPLHAADREDRGGNDTRVRFAHRSSTLHRVWDHDLIVWTGRSVPVYVDMLVRSLGERERRRIARGDFVSWAEEAQRTARRVYAPIPEPSTTTAAPIELGDRYANAMLRILDEQLLRGAVRLAHTLETTVTKPQPPADDAVVHRLTRCGSR